MKDSPVHSCHSCNQTWLLLKMLTTGILLFLWQANGLAQDRVNLSGRIMDASDSTALTGASVRIDGSGRGGVSDETGSFRLPVTHGRHSVHVSFLGYRALDTVLVMASDRHLELYLATEPVRYREVTVEGSTGGDPVTSARMGDVQLSSREIERLPALLGEADPVRLLQLTPGVQSAAEGGVGIYVRGSGVDQNLVLFDNALIYNPGHLMGFMSAFNPDVVRDVRLIKAGIPARYGGRLSSVILVEPISGRSDSLRVRGQAGIMTSRIAVNRSLGHGRGSFFLSARRAYPDLLITPALRPLLKKTSEYFTGSRYHFYDLSGGSTFRLSRKDILTVSGHYGADHFAMEDKSIGSKNGMDWSNALVSARWTHLFSDRMSLSNTLSSSAYDLEVSGSQAEFFFGMASSVRQYSHKLLFSGFFDNNRFSAGTELTYHTFRPNDFNVRSGTFIADFLEFQELYGLEGGVFAEDEFSLGARWSMEAGLRYSAFSQLGPHKEYVQDASFRIVDSTLYPAGSSLAFYNHLEPRFSVKYQLGGDASLKASYMHIAQYVHLATSSSVSLPMDIWMPSTKELLPQVGDQASMGYYRNFMDGELEGSLEVYYKHTANQLEFVNGIIFNTLDENLGDNTAIGQRTAYGAELFVKKALGRTTGWVSYTLSRTVNLFDEINRGRVYPAKYDRRHDLTLTVIHKLGDKWNASAAFIFASGNALTIPVGRYIIQGNIVNQYSAVNAFRMPAYHRLDLSFTRETVTRHGNRSAWVFSVYNAYNRANPFYILFQTGGNLDEYRLHVDARMVSLFPVIPSVSWRFDF